MFLQKCAFKIADDTKLDTGTITVRFTKLGGGGLWFIEVEAMGKIDSVEHL